MNEQFSIAGKVAVITGAGGVLGGSIAKCFMQQGAKVVAVDIRQEQLDKRVEELKSDQSEHERNRLPVFSVQQSDG